mmetsp:Transcript_85865/g.135589  ORF Transcript_85865/g.135589 Transcript_85865/m.135589 type:complete len:122 (-) Transcript_85865:60-425(-)
MQQRQSLLSVVVLMSCFSLQTAVHDDFVIERSANSTIVDQRTNISSVPCPGNDCSYAFFAASHKREAFAFLDDEESSMVEEHDVELEQESAFVRRGHTIVVAIIGYALLQTGLRSSVVLCI